MVIFQASATSAEMCLWPKIVEILVSLTEGRNSMYGNIELCLVTTLNCISLMSHIPVHHGYSVPGVKQKHASLRARSLWMKRNDQVCRKSLVMVNGMHDAQGDLYWDQVVCSRILILVPCKAAACTRE